MRDHHDGCRDSIAGNVFTGLVEIANLWQTIHGLILVATRAIASLADANTIGKEPACKTASALRTEPRFSVASVLSRYGPYSLAVGSIRHLTKPFALVPTFQLHRDRCATTFRLERLGCDRRPVGEKWYCDEPVSILQAPQWSASRRWIRPPASQMRLTPPLRAWQPPFSSSARLTLDLVRYPRRRAGQLKFIFPFEEPN